MEGFLGGEGVFHGRQLYTVLGIESKESNTLRLPLATPKARGEYRLNKKFFLRDVAGMTLL
jgi:hypothetical protein